VPPRAGAVIGTDLAEDSQAIAMIDHDVRVLAAGQSGCRCSGWARR
jgi:hypothetical protein